MIRSQMVKREKGREQKYYQFQARKIVEALKETCEQFNRDNWDLL